ncbi:MAG: LysE family transporter [Rickettsiales bacterium]
MSTLFILIKSWIIGIAIAAPVGPIGILCIRKTLEVGIIGALAVGVGAALADSIYAFIAGASFSSISVFLLSKTQHIKFFGGMFLLYLSYKEIKNNSDDSSKTSIKIANRFWKIVTTVFILTLANPMTILSFIGIFAGISNDTASLSESLAFVVGVFLGSMTWWMVLGFIIVRVKHKISVKLKNSIRYTSASILFCFGMYVLLTMHWDTFS